MREEELLALLREIYGHALACDIEEFQRGMRSAKTALAALPEDHPLRGEALLAGALLHKTDLDEMLKIYRQAAALLPGRSRVLPPRAALLGELYNVFALCNPVSGRAEENGKKLERLTALHHRLTGGGLGTDVCYRAQLAYFRGEIGQARVLAKQAMETAQANGQEMVVLCAADVLANIAIHEPDRGLWQFAGGCIRRIAEGAQPASQACWEQAQVLLANLDISLGILQRVPKWIREGSFGALSAPWGYRIVGGTIRHATLAPALIAQIQYCSYRQEPVTALNILDMAQQVYGIRGLVTDAYLDFFRAGCYAQLGEEENMRMALARAVSSVAPDGLWLLAAVFAPAFQDALYAAAAAADPAGPRHIRHIGEEFWDKLRPLREHAIKDAPAELSAREREVAQLLMQGRKNAEIAELLHISVRTVRAHLENIYRKNNVTRRTQLSDALERNAVEIAFWGRSS